MSELIEAQVEHYYTGRFEEHGATPRGVDWRDAKSQATRFQQLLRVAEERDQLSLIDYGCGYGALVEFLQRDGRDFDYTGYDLSTPMVEHAQRVFATEPRARFTNQRDVLQPADFVVASGIFNVRLTTGINAWEKYVLRTLAELDSLSTVGFAFNMLTSYSDPERTRTDLYYPDPCFYFDLCKRRYARNVALLHNYDLYEFTMLVRK